MFGESQKPKILCYKKSFLQSFVNTVNDSYNDLEKLYSAGIHFSVSYKNV